MRSAALGGVALASLLFGSSPALSADALVGRASVVDGDTIDIQDARVRFHGIDAPESYQRCKLAANRSYRCGKEAADKLDEFLAASRPTRCILLEKERGRDRWIGTCYRADGSSVSDWLVREGYALDWPKYSGGEYLPLQKQAESARRGIWKGRFEDPCVVRAKRFKRTPNC